MTNYIDSNGETWNIELNPPPVPSRSADWQYAHEEYDGPEDDRCGHASSEQDAKDQIEEYVYENCRPAREWEANPER